MTCAKFYALQLSLGILFEEELVLLLFAEIIFVNMLYGRGSNPFFYFILCTIELLSYDVAKCKFWSTINIGERADFGNYNAIKFHNQLMRKRT